MCQNITHRLPVNVYHHSIIGDLCLILLILLGHETMYTQRIRITVRVKVPELSNLLLNGLQNL